MSETVVVVGGCRFPGLEVAIGLEEEGYEVYVVDDWECIEDVRLLGPPGILERPPREVLGAEVIVNSYEFEGVVEARLDPARAFEGNVRVAWLVARAAVEGRAGRVVHLSTAAVYGDPLVSPVHEAHPVMPKSTYGGSRLAGEGLLLGHLNERGVDVVVLRVFNVYGPGQWRRNNPGVVHEMMVRALSGVPLRVEGSGRQVRDFVHVVDVVEAVSRALEARPGVYNVGTGRGTSILDLAGMIAEALGVRVDVAWAPPRPGDIRESVADTRLSREVLGFQARVPLEAGIRQLAGLYREAV